MLRQHNDVLLYFVAWI